MKKLVFLALLVCATAAARADATAPGINQNGQVGGLNLPTARSLDAGSAYAGFSHGAPYNQIYAGIQPIDALRITIRQQQDRITDATYPGIDAQVQLWNEGDWIPASALGYTNFIGQTRFGGEYLVFAKRYWDLDFNAGVGWGRYAEHGVFHNPLAGISSTYKDRARDEGIGSNGFNALYRGSRMGLFGSVTYQTPWQPLKLIAEFDRDPDAIEKLEGNVRVNAPFNVGARYAIWDGLALTAEWDNLSRGAVTLSYALNLQKDAEDKKEVQRIKTLPPAPLPDAPARAADLHEIQILARRQGDDILDIERRHADDDETCMPRNLPDDTGETCDRIYLRYRAHDAPPYAHYLGHAAYDAAEYSERDIQSVTLVPEHNGLVAGTYTFVRRDVTGATHFNGSAEEVFQSAQITPAKFADAPALDETPVRAWHLFTAQRFDIDPYEFGNFLISRERWLAGGSYEIFNGFSIGGAASFESGENFPVIIPRPTHAVRSNIDAYADTPTKIENLYVNFTRTLAPQIQARVTGGLLEEMYRGIDAELFYQPYQARWAVSAEGAWLQQRDPMRDFGKTGLQTKTAALRFYYEVPPRDLTVIFSAEQYLAEDHGFSLELRQAFQQGIQLSFLGTWSNQRDLGGPEDRGHSDARLVLHIPLQYEIGDLPIENRLMVNTGSVARDMGQEVELPVPDLWDESRPVSYGPLLRSWDDLLAF